MKILHIVTRLNVGGPARLVIWLTRELQTDEFQSVLVAGSVPQGEGDMHYFAVDNAVAPVYIAELSRELSAKDLLALYRFYRRIKLEAPDIVHTHTAKAGTVGRFAALIYRWLTWRSLIGKPRPVKVVHTFHGHVFHSYYGDLKTRLFLTVEKLLARIATDRIVVISNQQLEEINGLYAVGRRAQFDVIPIGIDLDLFSENRTDRSVLRSEIEVGDDEIVVGFVGRLTEIKNVSLLLEAASIYLKSVDGATPKLKFLIIGDGNLRAALENESRELGLESIVSFLGHRSAISELISGLDIVALTSLNEGTPLSLIEAMAMGIPVISTAVGGVVDLLGEPEDIKDDFRVCRRGVSVESRSAQSLYNGLIYLAKNEKLRKRLAERARQFVRDEFSKNRLTQDTKTLYRSLFNN